MSSVEQPLRPQAVSRRPSDRRELDRRMVYLGEGLTLDVVTKTARLAAEVVDLTPEGLGIVIHDHQRVPDAGQDVTLEHTGRATAGIKHLAEIRSVSEMLIRGSSFPRLGVAFSAPPSPGAGGIEQRRSTRYQCSERLPVLATARCALFFREWLHFRVIEISAGGMSVKTSIGNKGLLSGLCLDFLIRLPLMPSRHVRGRLTSIRRAQGELEFTVGVAWEKPSQKLLSAVSEYLLLNDKSRTPSQLRQGGLFVGTIERAVSYGYATRPEEHVAARELRIRAHRASGHLDDVTADQLSSPCDAHSRHMICRFGSRIVGYIRMNYIAGDPARSTYVSEGGHEIPGRILDGGLVEGGAAVIDPDFQRTGLHLALLQRAVIVTRTSGLSYFLGAVADATLDTVLDWGFELLETRMVEPKPGWRFRSHLVSMDVAPLGDASFGRTPQDNDAPVVKFLRLHDPGLFEGGLTTSIYPEAIKGAAS